MKLKAMVLKVLSVQDQVLYIFRQVRRKLYLRAELHPPDRDILLACGIPLADLLDPPQRLLDFARRTVLLFSIHPPCMTHWIKPQPRHGGSPVKHARRPSGAATLHFPHVRDALIGTCRASILEDSLNLTWV